MNNSTGPADAGNEDMALAAALSMVKLGARVLPVAARTKRALLKDWVRGASNDPDEVMAWAKHHPNCNWAMLCDRVAVLDVDKHPNTPDGHTALAEIEAEHGKLVATWLVHTPQDGKHFYFSQPKDRIRNIKGNGAGLEIRGDAGYVLLPGSTTPHGAYRWDPELCPGKVRRAALPAYLQSCVAGTSKGNGKGNGAAGPLVHPSRERTSGPPSKNAQKSASNGAGPLVHTSRERTSGPAAKTTLATWFETEVHAGGRNDALARGVGLMAARGTPRAAAEAAAKWWCRHRCLPPLVGREVGSTFDSIFRAEAKKRITEPDDAPDRGLIVHGMRAFTALDIPPRSHVLGPVLPAQGLAQLYAPRGTGKSYIALAMGYAIASGGKFLRWSAPVPRTVLYVDGEMPANEMQERMRRLAAAHGDVYPDALKVLSLDTQAAEVSLNLASELDQGLVEAINAEVIILDNRSTLVHGGRENDAESWDSMQPWLLRLRRAGRTVLIIDHAGRAGAGARGTSRREDVLDTILSLKRPSDYEPDQGARFEVHLEKARGIYGDDAKPFEAQLETIDGADHWLVRSMEDVREAEVADLLAEGRSEREIVADLGIPKTTVHRIIVRLRAKQSAQKSSQ